MLPAVWKQMHDIFIALYHVPSCVVRKGLNYISMVPKKDEEFDILNSDTSHLLFFLKKETKWYISPEVQVNYPTGPSSSTCPSYVLSSPGDFSQMVHHRRQTITWHVGRVTCVLAGLFRTKRLLSGIAKILIALMCVHHHVQCRER